MSRRQRIDHVIIRVPPEAAIELAADSSRFPEFNPTVEVPDGGRVEVVGNVYHQVLRLGPLQLATRWETTAVDPPNLAERPRPPLPWTTVEVGDLPAFGRWVSTSRYEAIPAGTRATHHLDYGVPDGPLGVIVDVAIMRPLLAVGIGVLGRRLRRWIEHDQGHVAVELRAIERRRLAAMVNVDIATAEALHAEDYQLVTPGGATLSRDAYLRSIADGELNYRRFEPDGEIAVRVLGPDAVALRYRALIDAEFPGGRDINRFWHTDIYERRDGVWQAAWSQATRIKAEG
jgi:hypothetical protein